MAEKVLVTDAVQAAYRSAMELGGIPYALLPDNHEDALAMLINVMDASLWVMRYLTLDTDHTDADLMLMMRNWGEKRLCEQLDRMFEESG